MGANQGVELGDHVAADQLRAPCASYWATWRGDACANSAPSGAAAEAIANSVSARSAVECSCPTIVAIGRLNSPAPESKQHG